MIEMSNSPTAPVSPPLRGVPQEGETHSLLDQDQRVSQPTEFVFKPTESHSNRLKRQKFKRIVFSCVFLTTGCSIFLFVMHTFGLLNDQSPENPKIASPTPELFPITSTYLPSSILPTSTTITTADWITDRVITPSLSTNTAKCRGAYKKFSGTGFCYKFIKHRSNFESAERVCQSEGGNLASIHSEKENDFLAELALNNKTITSNYDVLALDQEVWIGLDNISGQWEWVDGTPVDYTKWANSKSNRMDIESRATIVTSRIKGYSPEGKHWKTVDGYSEQRGLICKRAPR